MNHLLLPVFLVIPLWLLFVIGQIREGCWRRSILSASLFWAAILTAITELLNVFSLINPPYVLGSWLIVNLLLVFYLSRTSSPRSITRQLHELADNWTKTLKENPLIRFCLICLLPLLGLSLLVAIIAPPNNWDSMTYHMARVMYWMQHQSVAHYPTHNPRQLDLPPWSSFAIMHLQILSGGDRFANLVQWSSMAGCLVGVSLLARQLGAGLGGQVLATVVCATIPMGLLQSVTTQNDYVLSFWLVCLSYNVLRLVQGQTDARTFIEFGLALGLALLTKGTAYIYGLPLVITGIFFGFKQLGTRSLKPMMMTLSIPILLNFGHWMRNYQVFGKLLGISGNTTKNTLFTPAAIISNTVRNISLHLSIPYEPANRFIKRLIIHVHDLLHLDASDPRTTFPGTLFDIKPMANSIPIYLSEDFTGNLITFLLFSMSFILFLKGNKFGRRPNLLIYLSVLVIMGLLYNTLLAWQPWASRLHLPFFVLASAFIGTILEQCFPKSSKLTFGLVFLLSLISIPYLLFSSPRPILESRLFSTSTPSIISQPRIDGYFNVNKNFESPYLKAINTVNQLNCYAVGLDAVGLYPSNGDYWEYPFFRISKSSHSTRSIRYKPIRVENPTEKALGSNFDFIPCAVFSIGPDTLKQEFTIGDETLGSVSYSKVLESDLVDVYARVNSSSHPKE